MTKHLKGRLNVDRFDFKSLFVLDLANNHQGSLEHGLLVIDEHSKVVTEKTLRAGIKFQFRNLPEFVHRESNSILQQTRSKIFGN